MSHPDHHKWIKAIKNKLASFAELQVYKLVETRVALDQGQKILNGRFVSHVKRGNLRKIVHWKVCFVAKGDCVRKGEDYGKTTSPTMQMETFCIVLHAAAAMGWRVHQVHIKTAYLQAWLPSGHHVYKEQSEGFAIASKEDWVWELQNTIYSMPDAGRFWYREVNKAMDNKFGYTRKHCLYYRSSHTGKSLFGVYINDFAGAMSSNAEALWYNKKLCSVLSIKDLGIAKFCLGTVIEHNLAMHSIYLLQTTLINKTLAIFKMSNCHPVLTSMEHKKILLHTPLTPLLPSKITKLKSFPYRELAGLLIYLSVGTRPNIALMVQKLCQFLDCYNFDHWDAAKHLLWYLKCTPSLQL